METTQTGPHELQMRVHGDGSLPTLVYLPGLHGNWRLVGGFRKALRGRVRFAEVSYPTTLSWSLEEYAAAVEEALAARGIGEGWLLAESFSSVVAWPVVARQRFRAKGLILAGGFVRHPFSAEVRLAERFCRNASFALVTHLLLGYARVSRFRFRRSPETFEAINDFVSHLTEADYEAAKHRLHLVGQSDAGAIARQTQVPVYAVTGLFDPIVPWFWVRGWLRRNCPALRDYRIIGLADHNVLGTASVKAAEHVLRWMGQPVMEVAPGVERA
jgi:pimeloyl-ACP methyl ester carboxylesterase